MFFDKFISQFLENQTLVSAKECHIHLLGFKFFSSLPVSVKNISFYKTLTVIRSYKDIFNSLVYTSIVFNIMWNCIVFWTNIVQ